MAINPEQNGLEFLPFLRSPGGCLVTTCCFLVGGCVYGCFWLSGFNQFTFDCGNGRTIIVYQARDKEFDKDTTYDFRVEVYLEGQMTVNQHSGGTIDLADELHAKTAMDRNVVGLLWPDSDDAYFFIYDFRDNRHYSGSAVESDESQVRMEELIELLNNDADNPLLIAK